MALGRFETPGSFVNFFLSQKLGEIAIGPRAHSLASPRRLSPANLAADAALLPSLIRPFEKARPPMRIEGPTTALAPAAGVALQNYIARSREGNRDRCQIVGCSCDVIVGFPNCFALEL